MNFRTHIGHAVAAAMIAVSAAPSYAQSSTTDAATVIAKDSGMSDTISAAASGLMVIFAFLGLVMIGIGALRIYNARAERRATPPTTHIKYSEGIWRILVGAGLIINGAIAVAV